MAELVVNAQAPNGRERNGDVYTFIVHQALSSDWPIKAPRDFLLQRLCVKFIYADSAAVANPSQSIISSFNYNY